jgi:site-specific DNA recombinase
MHAVREKGINCSKHNFYVCVKNPAYCGKIRLQYIKMNLQDCYRHYTNRYFRKGYSRKVQDVLDGRKKVYGLAIATPKDLPLRNLLKCPRCPRMLTSLLQKAVLLTGFITIAILPVEFALELRKSISPLWRN